VSSSFVKTNCCTLTCFPTSTAHTRIPVQQRWHNGRIHGNRCHRFVAISPTASQWMTIVARVLPPPFAGDPLYTPAPPPVLLYISLYTTFTVGSSNACGELHCSHAHSREYFATVGKIYNYAHRTRYLHLLKMLPTFVENVTYIHQKCYLRPPKMLPMSIKNVT
jgi:hypothetical protein